MDQLDKQIETFEQGLAGFRHGVRAGFGMLRKHLEKVEGFDIKAFDEEVASFLQGVQNQPDSHMRPAYKDGIKDAINYLGNLEDFK